MKTSVGRLTFKIKDNIKTDLKEIGYDGVDWIELAQNRVRWRTSVNAVMTLWVL
jgi:hypothetical protein